MTHAQGMAWLHLKASYQRWFARPVPDWACTLEMSRKLRLVRVACNIGMPLAEVVLVRDEANDPNSLLG